MSRKEFPMVNREMLRGSWQEICGKVKEKWGELDEDQLQRFEGRTKRLVGYIHLQTGEAAEKIEYDTDDILAELGDAAERAADSAWKVATRTIRSAKDRAEAMARRV